MAAKEKAEEPENEMNFSPAVLEKLAGFDLNKTTTFPTYRDYLDSYCTPKDYYYLENEDTARAIAELGFRSTGEVLSSDLFIQARKLAAFKNEQSKRASLTASAGVKISSPFLKALADREQPNRCGSISTIIFLRCLNESKQEVSGYIDFRNRLQTEPNFRDYFIGRRKLIPQPNDLSYFNWRTNAVAGGNTPFFEVMYADVLGISFRSLFDRKEVFVSPESDFTGENSYRIDVEDPSYMQIIMFDHVNVKKM